MFLVNSGLVSLTFVQSQFIVVLRGEVVNGLAFSYTAQLGLFYLLKITVFSALISWISRCCNFKQTVVSVLCKWITLSFVLFRVRLQDSINSAATLCSLTFLCWACRTDLVSGIFWRIHRLLCHKQRWSFVNDGSSQWLPGSEGCPPESDWTSQLN